MTVELVKPVQTFVMPLEVGQFPAGPAVQEPVGLPNLAGSNITVTNIPTFIGETVSNPLITIIPSHENTSVTVFSISSPDDTDSTVGDSAKGWELDDIEAEPSHIYDDDNGAEELEAVQGTAGGGLYGE